MELDKDAIKSLSSETRVKILKSLGKRRKMPSELSKELKLAPSTIVEHLKNLENSGIVEKIETGHKWIYYELTRKGENLAQPQSMIKFVVILSLGLLMIIGGFGVNLFENMTPLTISVPSINMENGLQKASDMNLFNETYDTNENIKSGDAFFGADYDDDLNTTKKSEIFISKKDVDIKKEFIYVPKANTFSHIPILIGVIIVLIGIIMIYRKN